MCGHVIEAFHRVIVIRLAFWDYVVEDLVEVVAHVRVGVFVDGQAAGCMLHEYVEKSRFRKGSGEVAENLSCYEVAATAKGLETEF